jgi:hypothetical protein
MSDNTPEDDVQRYLTPAADKLRGELDADTVPLHLCPHCVRGIAVRRDGPLHCQFCGGTGVIAKGCEPLGIRCSHSVSTFAVLPK